MIFSRNSAWTFDKAGYEGFEPVSTVGWERYHSTTVGQRCSDWSSLRDPLPCQRRDCCSGCFHQHVQHLRLLQNGAFFNKQSQLLRSGDRGSPLCGLLHLRKRISRGERCHSGRFCSDSDRLVVSALSQLLCLWLVGDHCYQRGEGLLCRLSISSEYRERYNIELL